MSKCITKLMALHPGLDVIELKQLEAEMNGISEKFADDPSRMNKELKNFRDRVEEAGIQYIIDTKQNAIKKKVLLKRMEQDVFKNHPGEGMLSVFERSEIPGKGTQSSIERDMRMSVDTSRNLLWDMLAKEKVLERALTAQDEIDIIRLLKDRKAKPHADPEVNAQAAIFRKLGDYMYKQMKDVGINVKYLDDWAVRQSWNPTKLTNKKTEWVQWMQQTNEAGLNILDFDRMFPGVKDPKIIAAKLESMYDKLLDSTLGVMSEGKGKRKGIVRNLEAARSIHFADPKYALQAMKDWGYGGLLENMLMSIDGVSRKTAIVRHLGTEPDTMVESIAAHFDRKYKGSPQVRQAIQRMRDSYTLVKKGHNAGYTDAAKTVQVIKDYIAMTALGKAVIVAGFGDLGSSAVNMKGAGGQSLLGATFDMFTTFFEAYGMPNAEIASEFKLALDHAILEEVGRYIGEENGVNKTKWSKLRNNFYDVALLPQQFAASRKTNAIAWGRRLRHFKDTPHAKLNKFLKSSLLENNIDEAKWDIIRQSYDTIFPNGSKFGISPAAIEKMPLRFFEGIEGVSPEVYKAELVRDVTAFFHTQIDRGTPIPLTKEGRRLGQGIDPDDTSGMIMSFVRQFKGVPLKTFTDLMGHTRRATGDPSLNRAFNPLSKGADGQSSFKSKEGREILFNGYMMLGSASVELTMMGFTSMMLASIITGKDMPDPESPTTWVQAFVKGGAGGLMGDLLLGEYEKTYRSALGDLAGPAAGRVSEALEIIAKMRSGQEVSKQQASFIFRAIPGNNLYFVHEAIKKAILEQMVHGIDAIKGN